MAFRALVGKLRVLPERAVASRAFASQLEKQCPKCCRKVQAGSFDEMMEETRRRHAEEIARMKRNGAVSIALSASAAGALLFFLTCVVEGIFIDDDE